ncbi:teneurin-a isoform X3 [Halyomorpha halys]|uniref:teneurin-a isoform X3 n=1 Tax=Halyomorpha halys TaxID=286706 RepID=UPI0006D50F34
MESRRCSRQLGRLRRQRSSEWREYSTSEEEATARTTAVYAAGIASLLAGYTRDAEEGSPLPSYRQPVSPTRQASPYPLESTNLTASGGSTPNPSLSPRFGRTGKKISSSKCNTLGGRSRASQGSKRGVTSSSSMSSASSDNLHKDVSYRHELNLNEVEGETPPEPAPPEVPPRGPSLQHPLQPQLTVLKQEPNTLYVFPSQEYMMTGSPRSYPVKPPEYMNELNGGITTHRSPDFCDMDDRTNRLPKRMGPTGTPVVLPVYPTTRSTVPPPPHYSPYSPSRFNIDKRCKHSCSWKCTAIALILLSVALSAMVAYFAAVSSMGPSMDHSGCIMVEDAKVVAQDEPSRDSTISQPPTEAESVPTSTAVSGPSPSPTSGQEVPLATLEIPELGVPHIFTIPPSQFWVSEFRNKQPAFIRFNISLPWGANFAVYGRRNVAPSITQYDFVEFVKGGRVDHRLKRSAILPQQPPGPQPTGIKTYDFEVSRPKRSASMLVNVTLLQYLDAGRWFLSIYNDDLRPHEVTLLVEEAEGISTACPNDCSGHGSCYLGKCDCVDGYEGIDCAKSVCPVLCSNHGKYGGGLCHCEEGWKGPECDVPESDCHGDCSGHGSCIHGVCSCRPGWTGPACQHVDCLDPKCSGHGTCVNGQCYCKAGWQGANCSTVDQQVYQCLPGCSEHGTYDLETATCVCESFWTGPDCSKPWCRLDCGPHGRCDSGRCVCSEGWTGDRCDTLPCDSRCSQHGQCKNGTCVCSQGWNGRHCTLPGCVNGCSRHGSCILQEGEYTCQCSEGWAGIDCSVRLEMDCNDEVDNDQDGMMDCSDSECCSHPSCLEHIMCLASNDPVEVLLRKQPPSVTASFYQRVKFLVEENSVQSYAHMDEYSERRVSVMRGQVLSPQGLGIVGIRVSVDRDSRFGFTLTRAGGWFDVLVNGGGAVTLQFQRSPFQPMTRTVFVPWNQIVVLAPIFMQLSDETAEQFRENQPPPALALGLGSLVHNLPCIDHDETLLMPVILSTWMPEKVGGMPGKSLIFAETQMLQESIRIPGSGLHLMYRTSLAPGYLSKVVMRLTRSKIPKSLVKVHVRVEIEGSVHTKTYEADPNLTHVFAWNKRNVYKQKVYGVAQAKISIGYEHSTCPSIVWETQTATLQGFDVDISDVGGWSLNIHHHYNFHEGILQKGDGSTVHLKQLARSVKVVMGTGLQRPLQCKDCDGTARDARLLTPVALTSGPDGSLYVGDFNLIRRLTPDGNVYTVLQLSATQVSYQYYLVLSPADGRLYVSDPERHQILRVISLDSVPEPSINWEVAVGSGDRCIPGDETSCGDEGPALQAKLAHPKGLAIAADKTMYIADGTNIRSVDPNGIIHTLIGHHKHHNIWQPIPCKGAIPASQAQLQWPTGLALSALDGSLHFIDDRLVLKLTSDLKVRLVAGTPLHCHSNAEEKHEEEKQVQTEEGTVATSTALGPVLALAFSPDGLLYIADTDSQKVNAIRVVDASGKMAYFAGKVQQNNDKTLCDCASNSTSPCSCFSETSNSKETLLSTTARFTSISAVAVSPDGIVNVADQGNLHILALEHYLPTHDENGEFRIPYPATEEIYVFNRYGQHISTRDITTGKPKYTFLYSKNTSFGKLSTVTDSSGNKILFLRDYSNVVSAIENTQDHKSELNISGIGFLTKFVEKGRSEIVLDYDPTSGLLTSRSDSSVSGGSTYLYNYDSLGRLVDAVLPTGETMSLTSQLGQKDELEVYITLPVHPMTTELHRVGISMNDDRIAIRDGLSVMAEAGLLHNRTVVMSTSSQGRVELRPGARHPLLELAMPVQAEMWPMWSRQSTTRHGITNSMAATYTLVGDAANNQHTVHSHLWVNSSKVLGIEYDQGKSRRTVYDKDQLPILSITYNNHGLPTSWRPANTRTLNITYDRFNRIEGWKWGMQAETFSYDRHGLLSEVKTKQDGVIRYTYNDLNLVTQITLGSGRKVSLVYDEHAGLRHIVLASGAKHSVSCQPSIGFVRFTYTPPGSTKSYLLHYTHAGKLLQIVYPGDGARVLYRYHPSGQLAEVVHGDGITQLKHWPDSGLPSQVLHFEKDFEYRWDYQYSGGLLTEERLDYGPKTGLSNSKFMYQYDDNFRLISLQGRIGGQTLPEYSIQYNPKTGAKSQMGQFMVTWPSTNETSLSDSTAVFSRISNKQFQVIQVTVTIHRMEVFRMEYTYDSRNRISQTRTYTRNVGVNTYINVKNLTWDSDGQLIAVEAQEPWGFKYDANGNMLSLTYRGNTIPMEYNAMDRIVKFGDGQYRYDNRGLVVQNAREEKFHYNAKGLLVRATKRGRFDVKYYYDHLDRLSTRKDNYGNVTQFFYTNHKRPDEVTHIYSPRDGKLMSLTYDDRGHLIFAQVFRHKYYVATDQCGTPVMIFNQYGEGIREIMRSPYGHIVYDSNPYLYLPVDFCGGLLDQVTSLVHMPGGKVYDPLIGQWMSPLWQEVVQKLSNPTKLHLYRFNGNDPINVHQTPHQLGDERSWLSRLGYDIDSLVPQLDQGYLQLPGLQGSTFDSPFTVTSGFLSHLSERFMKNKLSSLPQSQIRLNPITVEDSSNNADFNPVRAAFGISKQAGLGLEPGAEAQPPFGKGILVSRTHEGRAIIHSDPTANSIYRDVLTSVFNNTFLLPFTMVLHGSLQDAFFFVKEDAWRAQEDQAQLKRFGSQFNTSFIEKEGETGSGKVLDVKIHRPNAIINLRYGTTIEREKQRLLHHAKAAALRKLWHKERDALRNGLPTTREWAQGEVEELLKSGFVSGFDGEHIRDAQRYPELAEDPYNIRFVKKSR